MTTSINHTISTLQPDTIYFGLGKGEPILVLKGNGDIFVKGKLIENDKEVVDALREFVKKIKS